MVKNAETDIPIGTVDQSSKVHGRDRFPVKVERILVPTDLTNESDKAIEFGLVLAKRFGAHLTLLYVYQDPLCAVEYVLGPHAQDHALPERTYFENTLKTLVEGIRQEYPNCDIEFRDGIPSEEIVRTAQERGVNLIIISTHHYNWLTRLAFGCDAEQILRHAPCSILVLQAK